MQKIKWTLLLLCFLLDNALFASIEEIQIKWNAFKCHQMCIPGIEKNLTAIRDVSHVQINAGAGMAIMQWNPNQPFNYEPFRYGFGAAGINIDEMRVKVKGNIILAGGDLILQSSGDGTRFLLIGPIEPQAGRYVPNYSFSTHPLRAQVREQLLEAEKRGFTVLIAGPLYLPSRWPNVLVTEQIKIEQK